MTSSSAASHVQSSGVRSIQGLTVQIKQMKTQMIHYANLLDSPEWKQQQADGGKAVSGYLPAKQRDLYGTTCVTVDLLRERPDSAVHSLHKQEAMTGDNTCMCLDECS